MSVFKFILTGLLLCLTMPFSASTQTYHDDSLVVAEILSGNQIENLAPEVKTWADVYSPGWESTQFNSTSILSFRKVSGSFCIIQNPQNGKTFQAIFPQSSFADVAIYSLSGRRVMTITKRRYDCGTHAIPIETNLLPRGTYLIQLNAENIGSSTLRFVVD